MIPRSLVEAIQRALPSAPGTPSQLADAAVSSGGCINAAARIRLTDGRRLFAKWNKRECDEVFRREAEGLTALRVALGRSHGSDSLNLLRVPAVITHGVTDTDAFLILEDLLDEGTGYALPAGADADECLARGLAALHRETHEGFGFKSDNFIGPTPQPNAWHDSWADFFCANRLEHMLRIACERKILEPPEVHRLSPAIKGIHDVLRGVTEPPSLVHGDLWGGNHMTGAGGVPAIFDPAAYFGHRETDLAMMELFGGFGDRVLAAYRSEWVLMDGYPERRDIYNLYHLLNHAILFGGGYINQARRILARHGGR